MSPTHSTGRPAESTPAASASRSRASMPRRVRTATTAQVPASTAYSRGPPQESLWIQSTPGCREDGAMPLISASAAGR